MCKSVKRQAEGSVAVMAQRVSLRWGGGCGEIVVPPTVVQRTTERCVLKAMDVSFEPLSVARLRDLAITMDVIAVIITADGAPSMGRLVRSYAKKMPPNVLVMSSCCCLHSVFLSFSAHIKTLNLLDPFFSLARLLRISNYYHEFVQAIVSFVMSQLHIVHAMEPPPENKEHASLILKYTILRMIGLTRAAVQRGAPQPAQAAPRDALRRVGNALAEVLNGNWASSTITHFCPAGCCASQKDTRLKITSALVAYVTAFLPATPALNRWGPIEENAQFWAALEAPHAMAGRAWQNHWPKKKTSDGNDHNGAGGVRSYQQECTQRLRNASNFWSTPDVSMEIILLNMLTFPISGFMSVTSASSGASLAAKNGLKLVKPMALLLLDPHGPLIGMQIDFGKLCLPGSELMRVLQSYARRKSKPAAFWRKWSSKAFSGILALSGGSFMRVELPMLDPMWQVLRSRDKSSYLT